MKDFHKVVVKKAFTLVELLVVMVIIGILIGLAVFGLSAAQKSARDTNRKNDVRNMMTAMETWALKKGGAYPDNTAGTNITSNVYNVDTAGTVSGVPLKAVSIAAISNSVADCTNATKTTPNLTTYVVMYGTPVNGFTICTGLETDPTKGFSETRGGDS